MIDCQLKNWQIMILKPCLLVGYFFAFVLKCRIKVSDNLVPKRLGLMLVPCKDSGLFFITAVGSQIFWIGRLSLKVWKVACKLVKTGLKCEDLLINP